jgi:hypothetical protein
MNMHPNTCLFSRLITSRNPLDSSLNRVFTTHGTLLGYSDTTIIKKARKIAALSGVTWRATNLAFQNNNQNLNSKGATLLKVLNTIKGPDGELTIIVVEVEKMLAAICDVKGSLLVAALVEVKAPRNFPQGVSNHSDTASGDDSSNVSNVPDNNEELVPSYSLPEHKQDEHELPTPTQDKNNPKAEEGEEERNPTSPPPLPPPTSSSSSSSSPSPSSPSTLKSTPKPSQMQILIWRAEAMAKALRDDLQDFKMPVGTL